MAAVKRGNVIYANTLAASSPPYDYATYPGPTVNYDYSKSALLPNLQLGNIVITKAILTSTAANAVAIVADGGTAPVPVIALSCASAGSTVFLTYDPPLQLPNGPLIQTLANGVLQLITGAPRSS